MEEAVDHRRTNDRDGFIVNVESLSTLQPMSTSEQQGHVPLINLPNLTDTIDKEVVAPLRRGQSRQAGSSGHDTEWSRQTANQGRNQPRRTTGRRLLDKGSSRGSLPRGGVKITRFPDFGSFPLKRMLPWPGVRQDG